VYAPAGKRIEIYRQGGNQSLAFTGLHLRDLALVQYHSPDQLNVEVPHVHGASASLTYHRKGLGQELVKRFLKRLLLNFFLALGIYLHRLRGNLFRRKLFEPLLQASAQFIGLGPQFGVAQPLHLGLERVNAVYYRLHPLYVTLVLGANDFRQDGIDHGARNL